MDIIAKPPEVSCPKRQEKNGFLKFCAEWVVFFVEDWLSVHFECSLCRPQISPQARCADTAERLDGGFPSGQFAVLNPFSTFLSVFFHLLLRRETRVAERRQQPLATLVYRTMRRNGCGFVSLQGRILTAKYFYLCPYPYERIFLKLEYVLNIMEESCSFHTCKSECGNRR